MLEWNPLKWPISCTAGIAFILLYWVFTVMSIALFPGPYSPVNNWLSDLGSSTLNPNGAILYNTGVILAGLALFPFFTGFYKWYTDERWRKGLLVVTQVVGFFLAFAMIMVGVFSEDYMVEHVFWSTVLFILIFTVLILGTTSIINHPNFIRPIGYYGYAAAAINLIFIVANTPLIEWFISFTVSGYIGLLVYNAVSEL